MGKRGKKLSTEDAAYRETALCLIEVEKEADEGYDKLYYLFFDTISPADLPCIVAWSLIEAHKANDPIYQRFVDGIASDDFATINQELERLHSSIRLGAEVSTSTPDT